MVNGSVGSVYKVRNLSPRIFPVPDMPVADLRLQKVLRCRNVITVLLKSCDQGTLSDW